MSTKSRNKAAPIRVQPPTIIDPNQRYSLPETFAALRVSPAKGFEKMRRGELLTFKEGGRTYAMGSEIIKRSQPPEASAA